MMRTDRRAERHVSPRNEKLDALLAKARTFKMTPEMYNEQRYSWVFGEMGLINPGLTQEQFNEHWRAIGQVVPPSRA